MSYNSKLASILAMVLGIGTGNASEGLEAVENAEQNRARSLCYLPKNMTPNKEDFESIDSPLKMLEMLFFIKQHCLMDGNLNQMVAIGPTSSTKKVGIVEAVSIKVLYTTAVEK